MISIGTVRVKNPLLLAPMANVMKLPLRLMYRELGFGLTSIGCIDAESVVNSSRDKLINLCGFEELTDTRESPVMLQLIGSDPYKMARAAEQIAYKADIIDINFGCPAEWVKKKGWGAALLNNIPLIQAILKEVINAVSIPVTAKIRIVSHSDFQKTIDIARSCEDTGIAALIVHTRTPEQFFQGRANWTILKSIKSAISIPLIGNGGISTRNAVTTVMRDYGCNGGAMVGIGALRNPLGFISPSTTSNALNNGKNIWDIAQLYARYNNKPLSCPFIALMHFLITRLRVNVFVKYKYWI